MAVFLAVGQHDGRLIPAAYFESLDKLPAEGPQPWKNEPVYVSNIERVSASLNGFLKTQRVDFPNVTLYPFSADDASLPLRLTSRDSLRQSRISVAIDKLPAWHESELARDRFVYQKQTGSVWRSSPQEDPKNSLLGGILGSLHEFTPNFRILNVFVGIHREMNEKFAFIFYDSGPGTPVSAHLQITSDLTRTHVYESWWYKGVQQISANGIVLIAKGALRNFEEKSVKVPLAMLINRVGGVLVEDEHVATAYANEGKPAAWDFSGVVPERSMNAQVERITFGYGNFVRYSTYSRPPRFD